MTPGQTDELDLLADHVLLHGLNTATLRPLAKAAGTSDRMLIYRYTTKEALIGAILDRLTQRLTGLLESSPPPSSRNAEELAAEMAGRMAVPELAPYRALWLEVIARAARGEPVQMAAATRILQHFHGWLQRHLPEGEVDSEIAAASALLMIEGSVLIFAAGPAGKVLNDMAFTRDIG